MQARLQPRNRQEADRAREMGVVDIDAKLRIEDLASGDVLFAATGVTTGDFLKGVRYRPEGALTHSVVMRSESMTTRWIESEYNERANWG